MLAKGPPASLRSVLSEWAAPPAVAAAAVACYSTSRHYPQLHKLRQQLAQEADDQPAVESKPFRARRVPVSISIRKHPSGPPLKTGSDVATRRKTRAAGATIARTSTDARSSDTLSTRKNRWGATTAGPFFKELFPDKEAPKPKTPPSAQQWRPKKRFSLRRTKNANPAVLHTQTTKDLEERLFIPFDDELRKLMQEANAASRAAAAAAKKAAGADNTAEEKAKAQRVLVLNSASTSLLESDFYRIARQGDHMEGWVGGIRKSESGFCP
jgi:hypothetical protein